MINTFMVMDMHGRGSYACVRINAHAQKHGPGDADKMSVYLDYNATTPVAPEVLETISSALRDAWANPSSNHVTGERYTHTHTASC